MAAFVASSDSDVVEDVDVDDIPLAFAPSVDDPDTAKAETGADDPDWVKSYTPTRPGPSARRRAKPSLSNGFDENEDDDDESIMDLLDDDEEEDANAPSQSTSLASPDLDDGGASAKGKGGGGARDAVADSKAHARRGGGGKGEAAKSSMPLVCASKLEDGLVLVQAETSALDLSGDVGAVGRVKVDTSGVSLDIKGSLYSADMQDTNTICVVAVTDDDARVTSVFEQVVNLHEDKFTFGASEQLLSGVLEEEANPDSQIEPPVPSSQTSKSKQRPKTKPKAKSKTSRISKKTKKS